MYKAPLVYAFASFVFGIILAHYKEGINHEVGVLILFGLFGLVLLFPLKKSKSIFDFSLNYNVLYGILLLIGFVFLGFFSLITSTRINSHTHYTKLILDHQKEFYWQVRLVSQQSFSGKRHRYLADVEQIKIDDIKVKVNGKVAVLLPENTGLLLGQRLGFKAKINLLYNNPNPYAFKWGDYMHQNQVYASLKPQHIHYLSLQTTFSLLDLKRRWMQKIRADPYLESQHKALLFAMLFGETAFLKPEQKKDYGASGLMHVLAISGLHIGLIYSLILLCLYPMRAFFKTPTLWIMALALLWVFIFFVGAKVSAVRAGIMLTAFSLGKIGLRTTTGLYNLVLAAFFILLFRAQSLFDVGFQLSFSAVGAILIAQPIIKQYKSKNRWASYLFSALVICIAAQMGTVPLTIYYFHQFSGLFLFSNLLVLPFLSFMLSLSFVYAISCFFNISSSFLSYGVDFSFLLLNRVAHFFAHPTFFLEDIYVPAPWVFCAMLWVVFMLLFFRKPAKEKLFWVLISLILCQSILLYDYKKGLNREAILIFHQEGQRVMGIHQGKTLHLFLSNIDSANVNKIGPWVWEAYRKRYRISNVRYNALNKSLKTNSIFKNGFKIISKKGKVQIGSTPNTFISINKYADFNNNTQKTLWKDGWGGRKFNPNHEKTVKVKDTKNGAFVLVF